MTKRELFEKLICEGGRRDYVPSAFFMHFDKKLGPEAVARHISYYRETDMDIAKVQFEQFPLPCIKCVEDIRSIPVFKTDYWQPQLDIVGRVVDSLAHDTIVVSTLYTPFILFQSMFGVCRPRQAIEMMTADIETTKTALNAIFESIANYMEAAVNLGVDGFFISTQGAENQFLAGTNLWNELFREYDINVNRTAQKMTKYNILHICDMRKRYVEIDSFADYPDTIVNPPVNLKDGKVDMQHVARVFNRPVMGGLDRKGALDGGTLEEIRKEVDLVMQTAPDKFILSADCTINPNVDTRKLREIVEYAHTWRQMNCASA